MANPKISFTELAHQVVCESLEPLTVLEIMERVNAITPITTKDPKNTIRNAVSQSQLIVSTGDGRYGWKPRLITGSVLRLTLSAANLSGETAVLTRELRDALWPSFFEIQKRTDRSPVQLELPDGTPTPFPLMHLLEKQWGSNASPEFWAWFNTLGAAEGDCLIFTVLDGQAKRYRVDFQRFAERDEAAIAERNQAIVQALISFVLSRPRGAMSWDITSHLLSTGHYQHPIPPDPLSEIWTEETWGPNIIEGKYGDDYYRVDEPQPQPIPDPELSALFGAVVQVYDFENPPDLPREYDPDKGVRRPKASRKAKTGQAKTFTFRVNHRALPEVWRDVEMAEDQTLEDLHLMIQQAYEWWDDHLYSFFLSGRVDDYASEIGSPWSDTSLHTHQVQIDQLGLQPGQKFLYFFDYGDSHEFDVQLLTVNPAGVAAQYPRIVGKKGQAPPQYPDYDEETGEMEWNPYAHKY
jgi:hypothetical protein